MGLWIQKLYDLTNIDVVWLFRECPASRLRQNSRHFELLIVKRHLRQILRSLKVFAFSELISKHVTHVCKQALWSLSLPPNLDITLLEHHRSISANNRWLTCDNELNVLQNQWVDTQQCAAPFILLSPVFPEVRANRSNRLMDPPHFNNCSLLHRHLYFVFGG
jgi:hypothetical protein